LLFCYLGSGNKGIPRRACSREFGLGGHNLNGGLSVYQKRVSLLITKS
jgi:hypothetical protein